MVRWTTTGAVPEWGSMTRRTRRILHHRRVTGSGPRRHWSALWSYAILALFGSSCVSCSLAEPVASTDTSAAGPGTITGTGADTSANADTGSVKPRADLGTDQRPCAEPPVCDAACEPAEDPPGHAADVQRIWDTFCATCHVSDTGETDALVPGNLDLSSTVAYFNLVNVASEQSRTGLVRVAPGDPYNSYLWHKLQGAHLCPTPDGETESSPPGEPLSELSPEDFATITRWICCGAAL